MARKPDNVVNLHAQSREKREPLQQLLFDEHGDALRSFLRARTTEPADLDDLMQEVFAKLASMDDLHQRLVDNLANFAYGMRSRYACQTHSTAPHRLRLLV